MLSLFKDQIVHVSGDSAELWIHDYNVRVDTDARVEETPEPHARKVLVTLFSIDGDANVTTYVRRSKLKLRDEDFPAFFPGGAHACALSGARKICGNGCANGYSCAHPHTPRIPLFGKGTACPLERYNVSDEEATVPWFERKPVTEEELMALCVRCEHGRVKTTERELFVEYKDFMRYCIDCPVESMREMIAEAKAEARCS